MPIAANMQQMGQFQQPNMRMPHFQVQPHRDPSGKDVTAELKQLFGYFDGHRKQWDDKAIYWYKLFVGYRKALEEGDDRANLHIPRTYQQLDTIRTRLVMAFFKGHPYIDFLPNPTSNDMRSLQSSEARAEIAAALVDMQLEKNKIIAKWYDFITSLLVFPAGILSVGWRYEKDYVRKKVPQPEIIQTPYGYQYSGRSIMQVIESLETIWDDNEINNVDFFDFWSDPDATNIDDARGVFEREWVTEEELYQRLEFLRGMQEGILYPFDIERMRGTSGNLERGRRARLSSIGISYEMPDVYGQSGNPEDRKNAPYELLHYWEDNRHAILLNRTQCIYDGPSPYWRHRKKPYVVASYDPLPNEFYGFSAVQLIADLQEEENTEHNQRIDNVSLIINRMWKRRKGCGIKDSDLISRPNGVIDMDDINNDLAPLETPDVASSAYNQENIISQTMENVLGTPPIFQGLESRGKQTATESMTQNTNAGSRFEVKIALFEHLGLKRLAMLMDMNNQQFISGKRLIKLGAMDSVEWRIIEEGELIGEFDYRPAGANIDPAANKEVRREQLTQLINQLTNMTMFMMQLGMPPMVNFPELIKELLESFDIRNAEKFLIPMQQLQQQMMMFQQNGLPGMRMPPQPNQMQIQRQMAGQGPLGMNQMPGLQNRRIGQPQRQMPIMPQRGVMYNTA